MCGKPCIKLNQQFAPRHIFENCAGNARQRPSTPLYTASRPRSQALTYPSIFFIIAKGPLHRNANDRPSSMWHGEISGLPEPPLFEGSSSHLERFHVPADFGRTVAFGSRRDPGFVNA
ncbi:hypothetical protein BDN67DRAFT_981895 [Paxillus ammoniavirescens]|nr:hypothetical protein BDN67DRAFT_981895 [Paxillus ammoniavirescens]